MKRNNCISLIAFLLCAHLYASTLNAQSREGIPSQTPVMATSVAGKDLGDRVNNALKACALQCTVYIPAGNYSFATTIELALNPFGKYKLSGDPGAVLTYTGNGDAVKTTVNNLMGSSQVLIEGFQLVGNPHAISGIHTMPTNRISIRNMVIVGFSGGDGILVEGTNSSNIYDNLIANNKNGIHLIPTVCSTSKPVHCGISEDGLPYATNAIHVRDNQISSNAQWAVFEDAVLVGHGLSEALNNLYEGNNFEANHGGAIYLTRSRGTIIAANYFEGSPREVVLGVPNGSSGYRAYGPVVRDNYFTTVVGTQYNIEIQDADSALIEGNSELVGSLSPKNCFLNMSIATTRAYVARNAIYQKNAYCYNGVPGTPPAGDGSYFLGR